MKINYHVKDQNLFLKTVVRNEVQPNPTPSSEDEGDAFSFDVGNEVKPNPTPSYSKKRQILGKGEKIGGMEKPQRSLDRFVHDANILMDTLRKPDLQFPYPAKGKYYLVDSGYPSLKGFLSPYNNASNNVDRYYGSWSTGKIVGYLAGDKFVVEYDKIIEDDEGAKDLQETAKLFQLRPIPPKEIIRDFQHGDEVEAYYNEGWWEGCIFRYIVEGK
ncbi:hypothetical protein KIW84_064169 [Lathyrus oleraceus]|uniref:Agenet domain-containing protein n=1 Tax=Pisum sativum TaxID=3888 RepID=A0A9D4WBZ9_PEA|nr:hypothetical protein KIW84_064169 [Pisum sativum]